MLGRVCLSTTKAMTAFSEKGKRSLGILCSCSRESFCLRFDTHCLITWSSVMTQFLGGYCVCLSERFPTSTQLAKIFLFLTPTSRLLKRCVDLNGRRSVPYGVIRLKAWSKIPK